MDKCNENKLTGKMEAFCKHYIELQCTNGSEAARRAGYSEKSANKKASQLLKDPRIIAYIEEKKRDLYREYKERNTQAVGIIWDLFLQASGHKETTLVKAATFQGMVNFEEKTGHYIDHGAAATHFSNLARMLGWNEENPDQVSKVNVYLGTSHKDNEEEREKRVEEHLRREGVLK